MTTAELIKRKQQEQRLRKELLEVNPYLTEKSGIYVLTREDENGFKYAYVGQAKHVLTRLVQHMQGYQQHIDLSLRKHRLWSVCNPYGWLVFTFDVKEEDLNSEEKRIIKLYADSGYQLRNKTLGGQDKGKTAIAEIKTCKGYYDGVRHGKAQVIKELNKAVKRLKIEPENDGKLAKRMFERFWEVLRGDDGGDSPLSE